MLLTDDQMTATIDRLDREADQALAVVNAKTNGFFHSVLSGDTGGGERTLVATVKDIVVPTLDRLRPAAASDGAKAQKFADLAHYAEDSLNQVQGYAAEGTVDQLLKATILQTATDVKTGVRDAAAAVAPYAAFGGGIALVLVLGLLILLYAPHPR